MVCSGYSIKESKGFECTKEKMIDNHLKEAAKLIRHSIKYNKLDKDEESKQWITEFAKYLWCDEIES